MTPPPTWRIDARNEGWSDDERVRQYFHHSELQRQWAFACLQLRPLTPTDRVLDFGCGDGKITALLAQLAFEGDVVGVDASADMIRFAATKFPPSGYPNLTFTDKPLDALKTQVACGPFDVAVSLCVFHLVHNPEPVLRNIAALLKPEGVLLLTIPVGDDNPGLFRAAERTFEAFSLPCPWAEQAAAAAAAPATSPAGCRAILETGGFEPLRVIRLATPTIFIDAHELILWMDGTLAANWKVPTRLSREFFRRLVDTMIELDAAEVSTDGSLAFVFSRLNVLARKFQAGGARYDR